MAKRKTTITKASPQKKPSKKKVGPKLEENNFLIVGMGASAGGLEAFKEFFELVPDNPGMAFVLVQHLDPTHKSLMVELLKKHTKMQVSEVKDNTKIAPDHVYVIPPNKDMAVFNGVLHLMDPTEKRGFRKPIDFFMRSLAEDQMEKAVGIVLSGTGTEGTLGLKAIKGHGGLSLVQDPKTAKFDGMPRSVVAADAHDFVLPINEIPDVLQKYAKNRRFKPEKKSVDTTAPNELLEKIFILLRNECGCNFSDYKNGTVIRRIEKRMALNQIDSLEKYIKFLQQNRKEVIRLFKELLIGVTNFFRDKTAFEALRKTAVPHIIKKKSSGDTIRIWVAGCSTGEEAYSLAILFDEAIREQEKNLKIQVFASDIDEDAIHYARQGIYPDTIAADLDEARLSRYFHRDKTTYRIKKELRDQVIFAEHNLIKDPPFSKQDMVSCRNLLIYLNPKAQKRIFAIFHYALLPEGILFLGNSESLGEHARLFVTLDRKHKIFSHKKVKQARMPEVEYFFQQPLQKKTDKPRVPVGKQSASLANVTEKLLLSKYAPACAIINGLGEAVYFAGNTGKYLQPSPGKASFHLVDMARKGLKVELRTLISKGTKSKGTEVRENVNVKTNGSHQLIDLCIRPVPQLTEGEDYYMITFEDRKKETPKKGVTKTTSSEEDYAERFALEQELSATKEYLRSTIEELEVSNEELKSSNEELQSSNEELQSTNEEMETSKEELQSVNEEIVTVNTELQNKIDELARAYDDMNNLLASTEIGTIFLSDDLKIKRFTPPMEKIINIIRTDVGRPINHLSSNLIYKGFEEDIKKVVAKLIPITKSVKNNDSAWYKMQILPYRTSENVIEGVVITFVDITDEKHLEDILEALNENYDNLLNMTGTMVYSQDKNLRYTSVANISHNLKSQNIIGKSDVDLFSKKDSTRLEEIKKEVLKSGKPDRKTLVLNITGEPRFYDLMVRPVFADDQIMGIACASIDITELSEATTALEEMKKKKNGT